MIKEKRKTPLKTIPGHNNTENEKILCIIKISSQNPMLPG